MIPFRICARVEMTGQTYPSVLVLDEKSVKGQVGELNDRGCCCNNLCFGGGDGRLDIGECRIQCCRAVLVLRHYIRTCDRTGAAPNIMVAVAFFYKIA